MMTFLLRRWFLLVICVGGLVAWLAPRWLHWTRSADPQTVMAAALFLSAWTMESRSLARSLARPWPALWAGIISYGFLPAIAWSLARLLPTEDLRLGLMITAAVPCTLASAVLWTRLAGGNEATALLSTLLTTALSWLATTLWLSFSTGSDVALDTAGMMRGLALVLVLPVGVGQAARALPSLAATATRFKQPISVFSRLLVVVIMLRAAVEVSERLGLEQSPGWLALSLALLISLATHLLALWGGIWSSRLLGFDRPNQIAVAFAGSQKTLPVSLYLFDMYFRTYTFAVVPMVFYHVGQLVVDTFIADHWAESRKTDDTEAVVTKDELVAGE
ncbi:MAG: bile acid:sodium symporter [Gemmataceae bacterium]|nr:bile acid:sodium symporter [Gemmataceae bacterium]